MHVSGKTRHYPGWAVVIAAVTAAGCLALLAYLYWSHEPISYEAKIDAEVVHVAPAVGGRIAQLPVKENDLVKKGDLLIRLDPVPYQNAVNQAAANVAVARAALAAQYRAIASQKSAATVAVDQTKRAQDNVGISVRTEERLRPLTEKGYASVQQLDDAHVTQLNASISLKQAREQELAALKAIGNADSASAALNAAEAALANAQRALEDTTVYALHNGRVTGLNAATGDIVVPAQSIFTLVDTDTWFAVATIRETEMHRLKPGECATVYSMIDRGHPMKGVLDSTGWGVLSEDSINLPRSVPYVAQSLNWVRVAQRFPVRFRIESPVQDLLRLGGSAVVELRSGAACR